MTIKEYLDKTVEAVKAVSELAHMEVDGVENCYQLDDFSTLDKPIPYIQLYSGIAKAAEAVGAEISEGTSGEYRKRYFVYNGVLFIQLDEIGGNK